MDYFERLVASAERVTRHAWYPGKEQAVDQVLEDIDDLAYAGRITAEQRDLLRRVLSGPYSQPALHAA